MCFSATASLVAGGILVSVGILTLRRVRSWNELPFAAIPFLFGIQQVLEGIVWLSFNYPVSNHFATYAYAVFSHFLWPVLIPISVCLLERNRVRSIILRIFSAVGIVVGLYLLYFVVTEPTVPKILSQSLAYDSPHHYSYLTTSIYLMTIVGSCLLSSWRLINLFGIILFVLFAIAAWFYTAMLVSVWCFLAAILSAIVYLFFYKARNELASYFW